MDQLAKLSIDSKFSIDELVDVEDTQFKMIGKMSGENNGTDEKKWCISKKGDISN